MSALAKSIVPALFAGASCCLGGLGVRTSVTGIPQAAQRALTRSIVGLFAISAVVYFLGTLMGTVWDVSVDPAGRMEARVNIRRDFFPFVRSDSSAVVKRKFGVAGDSLFEITRGHGQPLPEKNASIVCNEQLPSALETAIEEIRGQALPVFSRLSVGLDTWTALGSNLISTREQLDHLIGRADSIAAGLQEGKGAAGQLMTDSSVAEELKTLLLTAHRRHAATLAVAPIHECDQSVAPASSPHFWCATKEARESVALTQGRRYAISKVRASAA